ncbi:cytochrome c oxidase subunit 3 family protein [Streptomyces sp. SID6673]|uniref:Cytochrome aa3 subunit 3 n=2 Tax=Gordonia hankookensis TaxID=589403 RepID=A0ABR7W9U6_9ACTN|nr:cytochrome c oxidase subunit 3 [Gordonia hankookensis]NDZ95997.1 cytochrome c oxidase subunit 3 family protein [Streptomyces sp. SID11726]NEB23790.1 cytochrome c oxidase subunit 3 family protein [Streptomyces sp. SID6673]
MVIFAVMFVAFLVDRAKDPDLFGAARESLDLTIPVTNTMVLLVSSLVVAIGLTCVRSADHRRAAAVFATAMACAILFVALKAVEYVHLVHGGDGPDSNAYFMWLFILTGIHLSHVVIGVVVIGILLLRARRAVRADGRGRMFYEGGACYWHMVDLLWMVLFPLVYLVA